MAYELLITVCYTLKWHTHTLLWHTHTWCAHPLLCLVRITNMAVSVTAKQLQEPLLMQVPMIQHVLVHPMASCSVDGGPMLQASQATDLQCAEITLLAPDAASSRQCQDSACQACIDAVSHSQGVLPSLEHGMRALVPCSNYGLHTKMRAAACSEPT